MRGFKLIVVFALLVVSTACFGEVNSALIGFWGGSIKALDIEIEVFVNLTEQDGTMKGVISVPEQMQFDDPIVDLAVKKNDISFKVDLQIPAYFKGTLKGNKIEGKFTQGGATGTFSLTKQQQRELRPIEMLMEPLKGETNVSVKTNFGNLYGSLVIPEKKDKMPLVIIVPGSGPTDRDGNNTLIYGKGFVYRQIAEKLSENGIASLRYDKRGIGASADALIKEEDLRIGYLVQDVSTWITKYKSDERFSSIIILGHSEGSLIGMLACQKTKVNGFISLAGPGRNMGDIVIDQLSMQDESIKKESREIVRSLKQGKTYPNVSDALAPVFRKEIQPYLVSIMKYDPVMELRTLDIPILILQGTSDLQISVKDAELLASASNKAELKIIEGMNHMMRTTSKDLGENFKSYGDPDQPLTADFVKELIRFLKKF